MGAAGRLSAGMQVMRLSDVQVDVTLKVTVLKKGL